MTVAAPVLPAIKEMHTRFLYPFLFWRGKVKEALQHLLEVHTYAREGKGSLPVWELTQPEEIYCEEILDHCVDFLYSVQFENGCTYLKMNPVVANQWFSRVRVHLTGTQQQVLTLKSPVQVELFLSHFGTGILSLTLSPRTADETLNCSIEDLLAFNYQLSHPHRKPSAILALPHGRDNPIHWNSLSEVTKQSVPAPPDPDLPLWSRLGRPGVCFRLNELIEGDARLTSYDIKDVDALLGRLQNPHDVFSRHLAARSYIAAMLASIEQGDTPEKKKARIVEALNAALRDSAPLPSDQIPLDVRSRQSTENFTPRNPGEVRVRYNRSLLQSVFPDEIAVYEPQHLLGALERWGLTRAQDRLSVYTVVRFDAKADFGQDTIRVPLSSCLAAIAQIEEPAHAGSPDGEVPIPNTILNRRHWAAVGLHGAAHFVADQPGNTPFNEDRVPRVLNKYFSPYLLSFLQKLTLQRLLDEAGNVIHNSGGESASGIARLRDHFLQFKIHGYFTQISSRDALHRYYRLCHTGMDIERPLSMIQSVLAEVDSKLSTEHQSEQLTTIAEVQMKLEVLEVLISAVYGGELGHLLVPEHAGRPEGAETSLLHNALFIQYAFVLGGTLIGALLGLFVLRPAVGFLFRREHTLPKHSAPRKPMPALPPMEDGE